MKFRTIQFILRSCILFLIFNLFTGCTQPDGYIGKWFGSWFLEEMLIDGEVDEEYEYYLKESTVAEGINRQVMISFHANVFNIGYLSTDEIYGTWSYAGETLTLVSSYHSGSGHNSPAFDPFPIVLHFPKGQEVMEIPVTKFTSDIMQWQLIDPEGRLITYNFRKYP